MSTGYSGKDLAEKLGIRPGEEVCLLNPPPGYKGLLGKLPKGARFVEEGPRLGFVHIFAKSIATLEKELPRLKRKLGQDGAIWVSWPKRSSKVETDLGDVMVRKVGLENGLVDVKVCSVDATWSALKFVTRAKDRHANPKDG